MPPVPKHLEPALEKYLANQVSIHEAKVPMPKLSQGDEPEQQEPLYVAN
jgi:hypothetical protein